MALGKVMARGQVTLPKDVRRAADIKPGDRVSFHVVEPGRVEIKVLPRLHLAEALARYRIDQPVKEADPSAWQELAARDAMGEVDD